MFIYESIRHMQNDEEDNPVEDNPVQIKLS